MYKSSDNLYILTADFGTTSLKMSIYDGNLQNIAKVTEEYQLLYSFKGSIEFYAEEYWNIFCRCTFAVCKKANLSPQLINRIVCTTQGETLIPVSESGTPLSNAIVWLDTRAKEQANSIYQMISEDTFFTHTGISVCDATCPLCKILWIKENRPEIYQKTRYFLLLEDYLLFRLTGRFITEKSLLSTTGYFDIYHDRLWEEILISCNLDVNKFPEVTECGSYVGPPSESCCSQLGLSRNASVYTGAMDQVCAAVGAGNIIPGILTENIGTAMVLGATAKRHILEVTPHLTVYRHAFSGRYLVMPVCRTGGMFLNWFKEQFCTSEQTLADKSGASVFQLMDKAAGNSPPLSKGLIAIPYLDGSLQPYYLPSAKGTFFHFGLEHTRGDFIRSILESIGYMLRENIDLMENCLDSPIRKIYSSGGGSRSNIWCQIKANITNLPLYIPADNELTSVGAAQLALQKNIEDIEAVPFAHQFLPEQNLVPVYQQGYEQYQLLLQTLAPLFSPEKPL